MYGQDKAQNKKNLANYAPLYRQDYYLIKSLMIHYNMFRMIIDIT